MSAFPLKHRSESFQDFDVKALLWMPCKDSALSLGVCYSPLPWDSPRFAVLNSSLLWTVLYEGVNPRWVTATRFKPSAIPSLFSQVLLVAGKQQLSLQEGKKKSWFFFWKPQGAAFLPVMVEGNILVSEASPSIICTKYWELSLPFLFPTPSLISSQGEWERSSSFTLQWLTRVSPREEPTRCFINHCIKIKILATLPAPGFYIDAPISHYALCTNPLFHCWHVHWELEFSDLSGFHLKVFTGSKAWISFQLQNVSAFTRKSNERN